MKINNSLAPIASISETLSLMLSKPDDLAKFDNELGVDLIEGLAVITERSNSLNQFIQSYQQLTKLPLPEKTPFSLEVLTRSIIPLFDDITIQLSKNSSVGLCR